MRNKGEKYVADFETLVNNDYSYVWGYGLTSISSPDDVIVGGNINDFFNLLPNLDNKLTKNIYFHNLKFDGMFILSYLLNNGYTHVEEAPKKALEFSTLITDTGEFFSINVCYKTSGSRKYKINFMDSLKLLPFSVEKISEAFNLDYKKLDLDYKKFRSENHVLTEEEKEYIKSDVIIVAKGLRNLFDEGLTKMTTASNALNSFKESIKGKFQYDYPVLPFEVDSYLRKSYKGGFTYLNPLYKDKIVNNGIVLDVNSLYPSVMYDSLLPVGEPIYFKGKYEDDNLRPLFIIRFRCQFELKDGYIPTLQIKGNFRYGETDYLTSSNNEFETLTMTSVEFDLFKKHYHLYNVTYLDGFKFLANNTNFKKYIDYWSDVKIKAKEDGNASLYTIAKLMLNSLYGKFGTNPKSRKNIPYLDSDGIVNFSKTDEEERDSIYVALASFVTAYARKKTIETAQLLKDRFIYSDTDSVHLEGSELPDNVDIHDTLLGYWSLDDEFTKAKYIRQKTYMYKLKNKDKTVVKIAGMPASVKSYVNFENFNTNTKFYHEDSDVEINIDDSKLRFKRVKGGVVLIPQPFSIV